MKKSKPKWEDLSRVEQAEAIRKAIRNGRSSRSLADYLLAPPSDVEAILVAERELGTMACTNKVWYRTDFPLKAPQPRKPRTTAKQEKFLKRQGNLF